MKLAWGKKVDQAFHDKVFAICDSFKWNRETHASWLMSCMAFESGETFSPSVRNAAGSGATGLIQFMPSTAKDLGTSTTELADMSAVDQLDYVQKYFRPYASRIGTLSDMYMPILHGRSVILQYVPINRKSSFLFPWYAVNYHGEIRVVESNHNAEDCK